MTKWKNKSMIVTIALVVVVFGGVIGAKLIKDSGTKTDAPKSELSGDSRDLTVVWDKDIDIEDLKKHGKPIILDFTADWCVPCKTFNPILESVKKDLGDDVIIKIVDVDKEKAFATNYPLQVIPTQVLIDSEGNAFEPKEDLNVFGFKSYSKEGSGVNDLLVHEGAMSEEDLRKVIKELQVK